MKKTPKSKPQAPAEPVYRTDWVRQKKTSEALKAAFSSVEKEPLPERLAKLLAELRRRESSGK